jgi:phospholipid/cholesterol/gamma-HCH transport system substrate-binding protein
MRRSWASLTVGGLVLVMIVLTYFLVRVVSEKSLSKQGIAVYALFNDASGLFEKSRVQTAGISVGQIESRTLDEKERKAKIIIRITPGNTLYENAVVSKKSASLLGEYYLEIDHGSAKMKDEQTGEIRDARVLKNGERIMRVLEPVAFGDMMNSVGTLLPILRDILDDVRKLTSGTLPDIATNVNDLIKKNSVVLESLLTRVDHIAGVVDNITTTEAEDIKLSLKNVREITESIKTLVGTTEGQVKDTGGAMRSSLDKLQTTITNLDKTMQNMETVTDRLVKGDGTVGKLLTDDAIARNVEEITEDAGQFVRSITKLQTIVGLRSEYNFLSSTFKNYLSIQLMPRPDKFYLIELVEDPRGYRSRETTISNSTSTGVQTETRVTISEQLRFSLQFGKRVGHVAGRFGIKESTGGVGADLHLMDDRLMLSVDVFDAKVNQYPRVKGLVAFAIWQRSLYAIGGADDLANYVRAPAGAGGGFDWFLGLALKFNDEDLKSLLLFGGGAAAGSASK